MAEEINVGSEFTPDRFLYLMFHGIKHRFKTGGIQQTTNNKQQTNHEGL